MPRLITHQRGLTSTIVRVVAAALTLAVAGLAMADPPSRVARLGYLSGSVTFSPAGENDWVSGTLNRPLITGDRLWANNNGRAELQIGNAMVRLSASTLFTLTNLDDRIAQMHLQQGTLLLRVRRVDRNQVVEVNTPNLAFVVTQPGEYRVTVDADADSTAVITRSGRANVYDAGASYSVASGRGYRFFGAGLSDYDVLTDPRPDAFDRWAEGRDRGYENSISARYVSRDVIGYQDLDQYGSWSSVPDYGNIWMPTRIAADWAPYRDGHWSWVEPWGWTWVDDQPWGFTVSHYGRWTNTPRGWGWVPGPIAARPVYAPALVAFVGGGNFQVSATSGNVGAVGWFPLGPREVYRPAYAVSRDYFTNVNTSNTVINNMVVVNNYDNRNAPSVSNLVYANRTVRGAVVTVPTTAFVQSQPVARAQLRVSEAALIQAPVTSLAVIAPQRISVLGAAPQQPNPPQVIERRVVAQSMPPAAAVGFAVKERALIANPGKPIEPAALAALKPVAPPVVTTAPQGTREKPGNAAPPSPNAPPAQPRVEIVQPRASAQDTAAAPPPLPSRGPSERRDNAGQTPGQPSQPSPPSRPSPQAPSAAQRDPNPVVAPAPVPPAARPAPPMVPVQPDPVRPGNRPADPRGNQPAPGQLPPGAVPSQPQPQPQPAQQVLPAPVMQAPAQRGSGAPAPLPPADRANSPREQREAPAKPTPPAVRAEVPVVPAAPVVPAVPTVQPPAAPVVRPPVERAPTEPQRGRPERPEGARPAAAPPPPANVPEPAKAVNPAPPSDASGQKPRVVEDKKGGKRGDKKDDKSDKDDEEKQRK